MPKTPSSGQPTNDAAKATPKSTKSPFSSSTVPPPSMGPIGNSTPAQTSDAKTTPTSFTPPPDTSAEIQPTKKESEVFGTTQANKEESPAVDPGSASAPKPKRGFPKKLLIILGAIVGVLILLVIIFKVVIPLFSGGDGGSGGGGTSRGGAILTWWGLWEADSIIQPIITEYEKR